MRTLILLGCGQDLVARVDELLPEGWSMEELEAWRDLVRRLSSDVPPDVLLFTSRYLNESVRRSVVELRKKRYFVPTAVYLPEPAPLLAHWAGRMHRHGIEPIFGLAELRSGVAQLLERAEPLVGGEIARLLGVSGVGERLLVLLENDPETLAAPPDRLAGWLGMSRSTLYRGLQAVGLPPPGELQALFRLWPGVVRIMEGGRGEDAAFEAGCPHYSSFRKAVATHFGLTIREVRRAERPRAVLHRWAAFQGHAARSGGPPYTPPGLGRAAAPRWSERKPA